MSRFEIDGRWSLVQEIFVILGGLLLIFSSMLVFFSVTTCLGDIGHGGDHGDDYGEHKLHI